VAGAFFLVALPAAVVFPADVEAFAVGFRAAAGAADVVAALAFCAMVSKAP
jgi:hypothetical protein